MEQHLERRRRHVSGEIDHRVLTLERRRQSGCIEEVDWRTADFTAQSSRAPGVRPDPDRHLMPFGQQQRHHSPADHSGAAGDEDLHALHPFGELPESPG